MKDTSVSITVPEDKNVKEVFNVCLWRIMLLSGVFIYGSYTVLVHLCEVDGKIPFSSASMVLVTEIMKVFHYEMKATLCLFKICIDPHRGKHLRF